MKKPDNNKCINVSKLAGGLNTETATQTKTAAYILKPTLSGRVQSVTEDEPVSQKHHPTQTPVQFNKATVLIL